MTCRECQDVCLELARGRSAPIVAERVRAHVSECARCAACLAAQVSLSHGMRALADGSADVSGAHLEGALLTAFGELHQPSLEPRQAAPDDGWLSSRKSRRWMAIAAGAVLVAGGVAGVWIAKGGQDAESVAPAAASLAQPASQAPAQANASLAAPLPAAGTSPGGRSAHAPWTSRVVRPGAAPAKPPRTVVPAGFVTLPVAVGLPDFESGEIVRLELPVSSLPAYGVEIPTAAGAPAVEADLLIGQDGQPRAIRFVTASTDDARPRR